MAVMHTKKKHLKSNVLSSGTAESVDKHLPPTIKVPHFSSHLTESMTIRSITIQFSLHRHADFLRYSCLKGTFFIKLTSINTS